jgi:hypothetical protein
MRRNEKNSEEIKGLVKIGRRTRKEGWGGRNEEKSEEGRVGRN